MQLHFHAIICDIFGTSVHLCNSAFPYKNYCNHYQKSTPYIAIKVIIYTLCPGTVRVSQESQDTQTRSKVELCPSRDDPGIVGVSRESQDTQTGGEG